MIEFVIFDCFAWVQDLRPEQLFQGVWLAVLKNLSLKHNPNILLFGLVNNFIDVDNQIPHALLLQNFFVELRRLESFDKF